MPHPIFAAFWLVRYLAVLASLAFGHVLWLFVAMMAFFPVEALGIAQQTRFRDQLSEIWTWVLRKLGDERTPLGWNLLAFMAAAIEMMGVHVLLAHSGLIPSLWIWAVTVPGWALLSLHWWRPGGIGRWWPKT